MNQFTHGRRRQRHLATRPRDALDDIAHVTTVRANALTLATRDTLDNLARAVVLAIAPCLVTADIAPAATLDYDPATRTMTYTGGAGPDVPKWTAASGGWVQISDDKPMQPTASVYANCDGEAGLEFIWCPAERVVADLRGGDDRAGGPNSPTDDVVLGGDGNDFLVGGQGADRVDGGAGDDDLYPHRDSRDFAGDDPDVVVGGPGTDRVNYLQVGGPLRISLDGVADDGRAGEGDNIAADVENIYSASSDDVIVGSAAANRVDAGAGSNTMSGGDGDADTLLGGAGRNILDGGPGLDRFGPSAVSCDIFDCSIGIDEYRARDGIQEAINCLGIAGSKAIVDALDTVARCSVVDRYPPPPPPPARADADHDGVPAPADCNDNDARVRPGLLDKPGNGLDEDCAGGDAAVAELRARVQYGFVVSARHTRLTKLRVVEVPAGAAIELRCSGGRAGGCFSGVLRRAPGNASVVNPLDLVRRYRFKPRAVLELRIVHPEMIGKVVRLTMRAHKQPPISRTLCAPPQGNPQPRC